MDGRRIPDPGFAGDHGEPGAALASALAAYVKGSGSHVDALAAVRESRLLVPVVAVLGEVEVDERGLAHDKTSDMATVLLQGADGRMALLAFSGMPALQAWDAEARPVPVTARTAAQAALQDGAAAPHGSPLGNRHAPASLVTLASDRSGLPIPDEWFGSDKWRLTPTRTTAAAPGRRVRSAPGVASQVFPGTNFLG